jgi:prepilin signal peptidase PulO-like enzyme (type II secretory pathway)
MSALVAASLIPAIAGGAAIGSFLSVVAARVPPLVLDSANGHPSISSLIATLSWPASHCGCCQTRLGWRDNIPVLSYLLLGGHCRHCHAGYGIGYLLLEVACVLAACLCAFLFGWTAQAWLCFALLATLLALTAIDLREMLLPDVLVLPLLPLGLLYQSLYGDGAAGAVAGGACAFLVMWAIGSLYRLARGQDGLGGGDVKLAGVLGAWLGLSQVPFFLIAAFAAGTLVMSAVLLSKKAKSDAPLPFGPFLALSAAAFVLFPRLTAVLGDLLAV